MYKTIIYVALSTLILSLSGCGGSSSSSNDPPAEQPQSSTGVFIDSHVINVDFKTQSKSGTTNGEGEFTFREGETITFSIGDITFPPVPASRIVTPLDMSDSDELDDTVTNIIRMLQTLDKDGDPNNGIQVSDATKEAALGITIDFQMTTGEFEKDDDVINFIANAQGGQTELIPIDQAQSHFKGSLAEEGISTNTDIVGSYRVGDTTLVLANDGHVYLAEFNAPEIIPDMSECKTEDEETGECLEYGPEVDAGFERGRYSLVGDELRFSISDDRNGEIGIKESGEYGSGHVSNFRVTDLDTSSKLSLVDLQDPEDTVTFNRLPSSSDALPGAWRSGDGHTVIVFSGDDNGGHYVLIQLYEQDSNFIGVEKGSYAVNGGMLNASASTDFTGEAGLSGDPEIQSLQISVKGDQLTVTERRVNGQKQQGTFSRIDRSVTSGETPGSGPAPSFDLTGTWSLEINEGASDCGEETSYTEVYSINQTGQNLTVTDEDDQEYSGSLNGQDLNWSGDYSEDGGTTSVELSATVVDANTIDGSSTFEWSDGEDSCQGSTTFSGTRN